MKMSKSKDDNKAIDMSQRDVLTLNKGSEMTSVPAVVDGVKKGETQNVIPSSKNPVKKVAKQKTVVEIFADTFSVELDKKGNVKPATISKLDLKALRSIKGAINLSPSVIDSLCKDIVHTDPGFTCLTEIILNVLESNSSDTRNALFTVCLHIVSASWINKHRGSIDLFRDIFADASANSDCIEVLEQSLSIMYKKRLSALKKKQVDVIEASGADSDIVEEQYTKSMLEKQQRNLQLIGVLWLLEQGKSGVPETVDYLLQWLDANNTSKLTLRDVSLYLSGQILAPDPHFSKVLSLLMQKYAESAENERRVDALLVERERYISRLQQDLSAKQQEIVQTLQKLDLYRSELESLQKHSEDQKLNERAARTHLRDSEGKVRAKAFNLLSEEVLEPLRLSLAALQRENPKTESAIHQIELVLESIERDISWFKE